MKDITYSVALSVCISSILCLSILGYVQTHNENNDQLLFSYLQNISEMDAAKRKQLHNAKLDDEKIKLLAQIVANAQEYKLNEYDCTEFSYALQDVFIAVGLNATTKVIQVDCSSGRFDDISCNASEGWHRIVALNRNNETQYWEATAGEVILQEEYAIYGLVTNDSANN